MQIKVLQNPPIKEAIIEIRFNPNKNVTLKGLEEFANSISDKYIVQERIENQSIELFFSGGQEPKHAVQIQPSGIKLKNAAGNRIVIASIDRFAMIFLAPYTPWPSLRTAAEELYKRYLQYAPQTEITRLGMRYINTIKFPPGDAFFEEYMRTFPPVPKYEGLPDGLSKFETLVVMPLNDIDCNSNIRQSLIGKNDNGGDSYIEFTLDIDVYQSETISDLSGSQIWDIYEEMRKKKNAIFFGTLTDKAIALYE